MDARNWQCREAVFTSLIDMWTVLPEETDVLECGPRAAVELASQNIRSSILSGVVSIRYPARRV